MSKITNIILASGSPRRASLLTQIGITFEIRIPNIDEAQYSHLPPAEQVSRLSREKALSVLQPGAALPVVAADTLVALDQQVLGKPSSPEEAFAMLRALSGRCHQVYTGVTVAAGSHVLTGCEVTEVQFRSLSDREIEEYISTGEPMDKAGAYGIQERGALLVERIAGDYYNVVGLPLVRMYGLLNELEGMLGEGIF